MCENAINAVISHSGDGDTTKLLKDVFHSLMTCDKNKISNGLENLLDRLEDEGILHFYNKYIFFIFNIDFYLKCNLK